jgi:hypothetical protein
MSEKEFNDWWNGDHLPPNPYPKDSPIFWAWAGWQMGVMSAQGKQERTDGQDVILFTLQDAIKRLNWVEEQLCEPDKEEDDDSPVR